MHQYTFKNKTFISYIHSQLIKGFLDMPSDVDIGFSVISLINLMKRGVNFLV